jgi:heme/copper-type cytochrome/quinol oxidase subunit 1
MKPGLFSGFGNYLVVIYLNIPEVYYPRINNLGINLIIISYIIIFIGIISEVNYGTGWTLYP